MKTIPHLRTLIRSCILGAFVALGFSFPARAAWNENAVTGDFPPTEYVQYRQGVYDAGYGVYWCTTTAGNLYAIYWNGSAWTSKRWATNVHTSDYNNSLALDTAYHWVYYRGTDNAIWICYYTGSTWATLKVGTSLTNNPRQLCVDSGYHVLWYVNATTGYLWAVYYTGSAWAETLIDGVNQRSSTGRMCGVDEIYHFVWHAASDRRSLRYTYYNGGWTSASPLTLPGTDVYRSICADGPTHQIYNLQGTDANVPTQLQSLYWTGSAWASWTCMKDGNLPTHNSEHYCIQAPDPYSCYLSYGPDAGFRMKCLFTSYSASARNWGTCRQDNDTQGGAPAWKGLYPVAIGHGGRSVLCWKLVGSGGVSVLYSDL